MSGALAHRGRPIARHRGLKVVGTLAALDVAAAHGRVALQTVVERLRAMRTSVFSVAGWEFAKRCGG